MSINLTRRSLIACISIIACAVLVPIAMRAASGPTTLEACVNPGNGMMRLVDSSTPCHDNDTGLMTGCGNLYFHQRGQAQPTDADFVFLARGDGSNAWMNLNGRDVRLRQIKTRSAKHKPGPYSYRYGNWQITVAIEDLTTKAPGEADPMYQMKITLRKGRSVRVIHAAGDSDC